jgi:putative SOS response-associated peptidase YedK
MFSSVPDNDLPGVPNFNICPTNQVHTVTSKDGQRRMQAMRWGFIPHWYKKPADGPLLINARSETIATKPAFSVACRQRRCLIPASGFYEWTKDSEGQRLPWYIKRPDDTPIVFAGVWQDWEKDGERLRTVAIVTTSANAPMAKMHHRMPVVLSEDSWGLWLGEEGKGAALLMKPAPDQLLEFYRVDVAVNSNRATGPNLINKLA